MGLFLLLKTYKNSCKVCSKYVNLIFYLCEVMGIILYSKKYLKIIFNKFIELYIKMLDIDIKLSFSLYYFISCILYLGIRNLENFL